MDLLYYIVPDISIYTLPNYRVRYMCRLYIVPIISTCYNVSEEVKKCQRLKPSKKRSVNT